MPKPISERLNATLEGRRFAALLVALLLSLFALPLFARPETEPTFFRISVAMVLAAALYAASVQRAATIVVIVLVGAATFASLGAYLFPHWTTGLLWLLFIGATLLYTAVIVIRALQRHARITSETLTGGINVYLLLVFAFALMHASIEVIEHGSYTIGGRPLIEHIEEAYAGQSFPTLVYFSVTTLTTLGYGDIVPAGQGARALTSVQALIGQLYLAIFIGRMVGLQVGERAALRTQTSEAAGVPDEGART